MFSLSNILFVAQSLLRDTTDGFFCQYILHSRQCNPSPKILYSLTILSVHYAERVHAAQTEFTHTPANGVLVEGQVESSDFSNERRTRHSKGQSNECVPERLHSITCQSIINVNSTDGNRTSRIDTSVSQIGGAGRNRIAVLFKRC